MRRSTPALVEIAVNVFVSIIIWLVFNYVIYDGDNSFFLSFRGFLVIFGALTLADLIWKLIKLYIGKRKK